MSVPGIAAIVINYNSGWRLKQALHALEAQTVAFDEIIIVDNGSSDDSTEGIDRERVRIIETGTNRGAAAARNIGLENATSELVFMIDADMVPDASCAETLLGSLNRHDAQVSVPRIVLAPETDIVQMDGGDTHFLGLMTLTNTFRPRAAVPPEERVVRTAPSACYLLRRESALDAGGFCEFFYFYFEDLEFGQRLSLLGQRIVFCGFAVAGHDRGEGTPGLSFRENGSYPKQRAYLTLRNRLLVIACLYRCRTIVVLFPALLVFEIVASAGCALRGWLGEWFRAWSWLIGHRREWLEHRQRVQSRRKLPDRDILGGGPVPFARGLVDSHAKRAAASCLSFALSAYWALARRLI